MERRSENVKDINIKATFNASRERLGTDPLIAQSIAEYELKRKKQNPDDNRSVVTANDQEAKKVTNMEKEQRQEISRSIFCKNKNVGKVSTQHSS